MPTSTDIIKMVSSLQNDTAQTRYNNASCMPYFNMALRDLQEEFELNNIPVTNEASAVLSVAAASVPGIIVIAYSATTPVLPSNLVEIQQLWESDSGQDNWSPVGKKTFLPHNLEGTLVSKFRLWAWIDDEIHLLASLQANDLKLDYIKKLFATITVDTAGSDLGTKFDRAFSYLGYRTAALCSMFIGENETRAAALQSEAEKSLTTTMGISIKGSQSIPNRRRPFRSGYKSRNRVA